MDLLVLSLVRIGTGSTFLDREIQQSGTPSNVLDHKGAAIPAQFPRYVLVQQ